MSLFGSALLRYNPRASHRSTLGDLIVTMIFPGMDPYLEHPRLWTGFHRGLITYIGDYLRPLLRPRYIAAVEERVFLEGADREIVPDVWVRQNKRDSERSLAPRCNRPWPVSRKRRRCW